MLALIIVVSAFILPCGAAFAAGEDGVSPGGAEATAGDIGVSSGGGVEAVAGDPELTPGAYIVVAHPYYKHPVTGVMEDSGQNPAIGQGMAESVLGEEALLEVYEDGSVYVTARFSLMDNIENIKLSTQSGAESGYVPTEFTIVKESMGEGSDAKADIRFEIPGADAIARAEFSVIAMGRDVIFFMNFTDPVPGEGDFITSPAQANEAAPDAGDIAATGVNTDTNAGSEDVTAADAYSASADANADKAAAAPAGDGTIDVKLFIVIAAVIVVLTVVCCVVLARGKYRSDSR
jgi:hypothetical protein